MHDAGPVESVVDRPFADTELLGQVGDSRTLFVCRDDCLIGGCRELLRCRFSCCGCHSRTALDVLVPRFDQQFLYSGSIFTTIRVTLQEVRQLTSSAEDEGSVPNRTVPAWCAVAETSIALLR